MAHTQSALLDKLGQDSSICYVAPQQPQTCSPARQEVEEQPCKSKPKADNQPYEASKRCHPLTKITSASFRSPFLSSAGSQETCDWDGPVDNDYERKEEEPESLGDSDAKAIDELYKEIMTAKKEVIDAKSTLGSLTQQQHQDLIANTPIRIESSSQKDGERKLSEIERLVTSKGVKAALKAHNKESDPNVRITSLFESLVDFPLRLEESTLTNQEQIERDIIWLKRDPTNEAEFRRKFWEAHFFKAEISEHDMTRRVIRSVEQRIKTVAVVPETKEEKGEEEKGEKKEKKKTRTSYGTPICPDGAVVYYPFQFLNIGGGSISPGDPPPLCLNRANAYIWMDVGYAVNADDALKLFCSDQNRFWRLPVNRLFHKTDPKGQLSTQPHYLNHLLIEVKPYGSDEDQFHNNMQKAVNYLVLSAAACLHDYMKLLWLGAPLNSVKFQGDLPVIYLIAAVGFTARVYCMHIRKFNDKDPKETGIRYEAVQMMQDCDLSDPQYQLQFNNLYHAIQGSALYYATLHKKAMINAMNSKRDIATTERPDLSFVHLMQNGKLYFKMINKKGQVQCEGQEEEIILCPKEKSGLTYNEDKWGRLPKPDCNDENVTKEDSSETVIQTGSSEGDIVEDGIVEEGIVEEDSSKSDKNGEEVHPVPRQSHPYSRRPGSRSLAQPWPQPTFQEQ